MRNGARFYCKTVPIELNVYDNEEKLCLKTTYQAQVEAEVECQRLNLERRSKRIFGTGIHDWAIGMQLSYKVVRRLVFRNGWFIGLGAHDLHHSDVDARH